MKFEYQIFEQDFLDFQIFTASKSDRINRKKRNGWILLTVGSILVAFYFYLIHINFMTLYFAFAAIACGIFYPQYFKWRYKKHYRTYTKENYSKRFGQTEIIEISGDSIFSKDKTGEVRINISEIERIDETDNHFFMKISNGLALLIPKRELPNANELREKLVSIGLTVNKETNWKWN